MTEEQDTSDSGADALEPTSPPAAEEARPPADAANRTVAELKEHGDKLAHDIESTRQDWEAKQDSAGIPGAMPEDGIDPAGLIQEAPGEPDEDAGAGERDEDAAE